MGKFIEEFYCGNIDPQARSTKQNKAVQKQMEVLMLNEEILTEALSGENKKYYIVLDDFERRVVVNCLNEMRNNLIANGKLNGCLVDLDKQAEDMFSRFAAQMAMQENVTGKLRADNQKEWIGPDEQYPKQSHRNSKYRPNLRMMKGGRDFTHYRLY